MELAFAGLHQLCGPMLDLLPRLPAPQRQALEIVFGRSSGAAPDRFLVGLAVLSLFSEAADGRPLLCVIDDAQWLDQASALTLAFVSRRLLAEPVGLVFAAREPGKELQHVSELEVRGLRNGDARALLASAALFGLDERVRDRIVAETHGNPLALLELPRGLTATQLAGGFGISAAHAVRGRIEDSFLRQLNTLSDDAARLSLVAAAEPLGDPALLWRAAERLGIGSAAADASTEAGLLTIGDRVTFRHPLVRSAIYGSASVQERRAVHLALAEATDRELDPDRRAWHLAAAAAQPDEEVAFELERSAGRAQARGGIAAAAAFLQRAVALTRDADAAWRARAGRRAGEPPGRRVRRGRAGCSPRRRLWRSTSCSARRSTCCVLSWRSHRAEAPRRRRSCWQPLDASNAWTSRSRARRTWTHSPRRCSGPGSMSSSGCRRWRRRLARRLAHRMTSPRPPTCCSTRWSPSPTTTTRPFHDAGRRCRGSPATTSRPRNGCAGCGRDASSPSSCGMTSARTSCHAAASRSPARRAC